MLASGPGEGAGDGVTSIVSTADGGVGASGLTACTLGMAVTVAPVLTSKIWAADVQPAQRPISRVRVEAREIRRMGPPMGYRRYDCTVAHLQSTM